MLPGITAVRSTAAIRIIGGEHVKDSLDPTGRTRTQFVNGTAVATATEFGRPIKIAVLVEDEFGR